MGYTLPYLESFKDRHGKRRFYYRRAGRRIALKNESGTPEFLAEYAQIHKTFEAPEIESADPPGTFGHLVATYLASPEFRQMRPSSQAEYRRHLERMRGKLGKFRLPGITKQVVLKYRDGLQETPRTANNALAYLKQLLNFAVDREMVPINLAAGVKPLRDDGEGWQPWPEAALEKFAAQSQGVSRTAFYLALYTGQRRADCLAMRWDAIKDGGIYVKQQKTGAEVWIPIDPRLATEIEAARQEAVARMNRRREKGQAAAMPTTILHRNNGQPYTNDGFGTLWNREQHRLGCNGLPFHGLRKNATIALLEVGCTPDEVKAITGHATDEMVAYYGKRVNQKKLAKRAMRKLAEGRFGDQKENE